MAEKLSLWSAEESQSVLKLLEEDEDLKKHLKNPPFDAGRFETLIKEYEMMKKAIKKGRVTPKFDFKRSNPPLQMPAWESLLSEKEITATIAYLIALGKWDDEED
jgi:hypothetical protein